MTIQKHFPILKDIGFYWSLFCIRFISRFPILLHFIRYLDQIITMRKKSILYQYPRKKISGSLHKAPRSIVFLNNAYYNFYYLAKALRKRGWDAISANLEPVDGPYSHFYHGDDLNLYHPDPKQYENALCEFHGIIKQRFKMLHFYGAGYTSIFQRYFNKNLNIIPWDFLELKKHGLKIGFTHSGCNDLSSQTSFYKWSGGMCDFCKWRTFKNECSNKLNLNWGKIAHALCDLICIESEPQLDYKKGDKVFPDPLTCATDSEVWYPDLPIPDEFRKPKEKDELFIYHGVGSYQLRDVSGKNIKGTHAVFETIERLQKEGHKIKLLFVKDVPSKYVRFIQAQADIVIDQLLYGRYGANGRESLMLGKPMICHINKSIENGDLSPCIAESPIISANTETLYDALRELILFREKRIELGKQSREYALQWWSADACAEKFEFVYDKLFEGFSPKEIAYELRKTYDSKNFNHWR